MTPRRPGRGADRDAVDEVDEGSEPVTDASGRPIGAARPERTGPDGEPLGGDAG